MKKEGGFSPALEDYLEAILELSETNEVVRVTDIAARLGIAKPSVAQALGHLKRLGLMTQDRYGPVWLTEEGRARAAEVRRRHQALFYFLTAVLGVPGPVAERDACRMEHAISPQTLDRLLAFLASNRWVPEGELPAPSASQVTGGKRLSELMVGEEAEVLRVTARGALRRRLLNIGLIPGVRLLVEGVAPLGDPIAVRVKGFTLTLRQKEAASVIVLPVAAAPDETK